MKQSDTSLRDLEIVYEDENGKDFTKTFSVHEEVIDYIEFLEELMQEARADSEVYRLFYCQHFANMTYAN